MSVATASGIVAASIASKGTITTVAAVLAGSAMGIGGLIFGGTAYGAYRLYTRDAGTAPAGRAASTN